MNKIRDTFTQIMDTFSETRDSCNNIRESFTDKGYFDADKLWQRYGNLSVLQEIQKTLFMSNGRVPY